MIDFHVDKFNRYLKGVISQIIDEGMNEELFKMLCLEMKFSRLVNMNYRDLPLYLKKDDKFYLMLFTDHNDIINGFNILAFSHYCFKTYLDILNGPVYHYMEDDTHNIRFNRNYTDENYPDGMIIKSDAGDFIIEGELLKRVNELFNVDLYSVAELKSKYEKMDSSRLESLLSQSLLDWDEIIREMGNSTILYKTEFEVEETEEDSISGFSMGYPLGFKNELSVYASNDEFDPAFIINFKSAADHALNQAMPGLNVICNGREVFMSRNLLIEKYELIGKCCFDEKLKRSFVCIFNL